jgi:hypothetical protein
MANRADAAEALHGDRNFPVRPALDEGLKAAELDDVEADLMNSVPLVEENRHLAVPLHTRDRFDGDSAQLLRRLRGFEVEHGKALNRSG